MIPQNGQAGWKCVVGGEEWVEVLERNQLKGFAVVEVPVNICWAPEQERRHGLLAMMVEQENTSMKRHVGDLGALQC